MSSVKDIHSRGTAISLSLLLLVASVVTLMGFDVQESFALLPITDFNGDGYDDLAIDVSFEDINGISDAGAVNVLYGSAVSLTVTNDQFWHQDIRGVEDQVESGDLFGLFIPRPD